MCIEGGEVQVAERDIQGWKVYEIRYYVKGEGIFQIFYSPEGDSGDFSLQARPGSSMHFTAGYGWCLFLNPESAMDYASSIWVCPILRIFPVIIPKGSAYATGRMHGTKCIATRAERIVWGTIV